MEHIVADAHNDLLVEVEFFRHEEHSFRDRWLDQLRRGRVGLQVCPISVDIHELPEWGMRRSLQQIVALHRAVAEMVDQVLVVRDDRDLETVRADGRTGLFLSMEGAEPLGQLPGPAGRGSAVATSLGALGERVQKPKDLAPALERALEADRLTVLDVVTDIDAECPWGA